jgi:hypothetical protein
MSDGFQVTMTGLQQAARVFRAEAGTFAAIMPSGGPASVDGGSAEINDALSLVLGAIGGLHTQLAGVIDQHGGKLEAAYGTYRDAEDANVKMTEAITTGPGPG